MSFISSLLFFTIATVFANYLWNRRKYYYLSLKLDSVLGLPFIGIASSLNSINDLLPYFNELKVKFRHLYGIIWFGTEPIFYVRQPEMVKNILNSPSCVQKMDYYDIFTKHYGAGIISTSPPVWNYHRKLLDPAFHTKILKSFVPIFNNEINLVVNRMETEFKNKEFNILPILQLCTIRITCQTTMGVKMRPEDKEKNEKLISAFQNIGKMTIVRSVNPQYHPDFIFYRTKYGQILKESKEYLFNFVTEVINRQLDAANNNEESSDTEVDLNYDNIFIGRAIELYKKGEFTFEDVISESNDIILGGYDTTANTTSYTIMCLAMFPHYQEKVFEELVRIFPDKNDFYVEEEHLKDMKYLEMVINENMRLMAPIPFIGRSNMKEFPLDDGTNLNLPEKTQILIDIFNMQRDESVWGPKAKMFYPEHFDHENMKKIHSFAFIPFTKGQRTCIGSKYAAISLKVILATLLRKYKFTTDYDFNDMKFAPNVMLKVRSPPLLRIVERKY